jgi:hypothetical protein
MGISMNVNMNMNTNINMQVHIVIYMYSITWLACTWLEKCTMSAAIINITCFNCILGRKKRN